MPKDKKELENLKTIRGILEENNEKAYTMTELTHLTGQSMPTVSQKVKSLVERNLVKKKKVGRKKYAMWDNGKKEVKQNE